MVSIWPLYSYSPETNTSIHTHTHTPTHFSSFHIGEMQRTCKTILFYALSTRHNRSQRSMLYSVICLSLQLVVPLGLLYSHWSIPYWFLTGRFGHRHLFCHASSPTPPTLCFGYQLFVDVFVSLQNLDPALPGQFFGRHLPVFRKWHINEKCGSNRKHLVSSRQVEGKIYY